MKICTKCRQEKSEERFGKDPRGRNGLKAQCISCNTQSARARVVLNPVLSEVHREADKRWYHKNKYTKNASTKKWQADNRVRHQLKKSCYAKSHRDKINQRRKKQYDEDPAFKLGQLLRSRIYKAVSRGSKTGSGIRDLGCSVEEFKKYIEARFLPGMSWENWSYRGWHIDHIRPLSSFDLTDREQFLRACHYTNLQPLWAEKNLIKSDSLEWKVAA